MAILRVMLSFGIALIGTDNPKHLNGGFFLPLEADSYFPCKPRDNDLDA